MPSQADNPEGFWETLRVRSAERRIINELGGAWDLPPKDNENFTHARLDPLRMKARLLIEGFDSAHVWGWKDPRNSLTIPSGKNLLPDLKNSYRRAQSAGGRLLNAGAKWNVLFVWFAPLGNL